MSPRMYMYPSFYASYMYVHVLRTCLVAGLPPLPVMARYAGLAARYAGKRPATRDGHSS